MICCLFALQAKNILLINIQIAYNNSNEVTKMDELNIALETLCIIISLIMLFNLCFKKVKNDKTVHWLTLMLLFNIVVLVCDLITFVIGETDLIWFLTLVNSIVYAGGYVIEFLFCLYILEHLKAKQTMNFSLIKVFFIACIFAIILVVVSYFNHMYFYFNDVGDYVRGPYYWISQFYPIIIILYTFYIIYKYRKVLGKHDTFYFTIYGLLPVIAMLIQIFSYGITFLYIATTLSMLIIHLNIQNERESRLYQQEISLTKANISIMLSQIQPHFLYNAITSIKHLCDTQPALASQALERFSYYLRNNLDSLKTDQLIPFKKELEHIEEYIYLEKIRMDERLNVRYEIEVDDFEVPTLTIEPLVENAIRHGIAKKVSGGTLLIKTQRINHEIYITIQDDGVGFDVSALQNEDKKHLGIENVRKRLKLQSNARLLMESIPKQGCTCTIIIKG